MEKLLAFICQFYIFLFCEQSFMRGLINIYSYMQTGNLASSLTTCMRFVFACPVLSGLQKSNEREHFLLPDLKGNASAVPHWL